MAWWIPAGIILAASLVMALSSATDRQEENPEYLAKAVIGFLDLSSCTFSGSDMVNLDGEWEFFPGQLLSPEDLASGPAGEAVYLPVPGTWNNPAEGYGHYPAAGFGTYRLRVRVSDPNIIYALKTREVFSSYRIWVNNEEISSAGVPGRTEDETVARYGAGVAPFHTDRRDLEIVIQVSNFAYKDGGIRDSIGFGSADSLFRRRTISLAVDYILLGSLIIMAFYHIGLYFLRRDEVSPLLFGAYCLMVAMRIPMMNDMLVLTVLPGFSWSLQIRIIVLGYFIAVPLFATFVASLYPKESHKAVIRIVQGLGIAFSVPVLLAPPLFFSKTEVFYQVFLLLAAGYSMATLIKAVLHKRPEAGWMIFGCLVLLAATVNDVMHAQYITTFHTHQNLTPFGLFIFFFVQSFILSARSSRLYRIANTDELTRIPNRRHFMEIQEKAFLTAEQTGADLALLFLDIDHFKKVNDTWGHDCGDVVLQQFADIIESAGGRMDMAARLGGEEFALMTRGSIEQAGELAEEIRRTVESTEFSTSEGALRITVSIGISSNTDRENISLKKLFISADRALYRAKSEGRNRVAVEPGGNHLK